MVVYLKVDFTAPAVLILYVSNPRPAVASIYPLLNSKVPKKNADRFPFSSNKCYNATRLTGQLDSWLYVVNSFNMAKVNIFLIAEKHSQNY